MYHDNGKSDDELMGEFLQFLSVGTALARNALENHLGPRSPMVGFLSQTAPVLALHSGARAVFQGLELDEEVREQIGRLVSH